jgi:hypothetical protein
MHAPTPMPKHLAKPNAPMRASRPAVGPGNSYRYLLISVPAHAEAALPLLSTLRVTLRCPSNPTTATPKHAEVSAKM